jgi:hypothetical protein
MILAALPGLGGEDADTAELRLHIRPNEVLTYNWSISTNSESSGHERGKNFTLKAETGFNMVMALQGSLGNRKDSTTPVTVRTRDVSYLDKRSIDTSKTELTLSRGKMKYIEDGKVLVDSDNDVGLDRMKDYQEHIKRMEAAEMRMTLDPAGRQSDVQGDDAVVKAIKNGGAQGVFPILSGKATKVGDSWEDTFVMPMMQDFKLAQPASVRSHMTFSRWNESLGRKLAQIDIISKWDNRDLKGENDAGMLVEITKVNGSGGGTCLFDPASGHFVEGTLSYTMKYRIDGEKEGQKSGLDVSAKTQFTFTEKK